MADDLLPLDVVKYAEDDPNWTGVVDRIVGAEAWVILNRAPTGVKAPTPVEIGVQGPRTQPFRLDLLRRVGTLRTGRGGADSGDEAYGRQLLAEYQARMGTGTLLEEQLLEDLPKKSDG